MQNDMRDRLVELLNEVGKNILNYPTDNFITFLADYLIENGVIVSPCKVGDTVWSKGAFTEEIYPFKVYEVGVCHAIYHNPKGLTNTREFKEDNMGKTVFLTKEGAEQMLKGNEG